jgi:hypothetical protein
LRKFLVYGLFFLRRNILRKFLYKKVMLLCRKKVFLRNFFFFNLLLTPSLLFLIR